MSKWYLHIQIPFGCRETIPAKPASRVCSKLLNKQDEYVSNAYPSDNEKIWMVWMWSHCVLTENEALSTKRHITVMLSSPSECFGGQWKLFSLGRSGLEVWMHYKKHSRALSRQPPLEANALRRCITLKLLLKHCQVSLAFTSSSVLQITQAVKHRMMS